MKNSDRYRFVQEMWEIQAVLYFILGILIDQSYPSKHWLAVCVWIYGLTSFVGTFLKAHQRAKSEKMEAKND